MKLVSIFVAFSFLLLNVYSQPFITRWDLSLPTVDTIQFSVVSSGPVTYSWETIPAGSSGSGVITGTMANITGMPAGSTVRLKIDTANFRQFQIFGGSNFDLVDVEQWGAVHWSSMQASFLECASLNISATDIPDLSSVKSTYWMFKSCYKLNGPLNINDWNMEMVEDMTEMFSHSPLFNQNIGNWNTSSVQKMRGVFSHATSFNQDIGNWNTGSVQDMHLMFYSAKSFNQNIENWNTTSVKNMFAMFREAISFNQSIGTWDISAVTDMSQLFDSSGVNCSNYSSTLSGWSNNSNTPVDITLGAAEIYFDSLAVADRDYLINTKGWTIIGDVPCYIISASETPLPQLTCTITPNPVKDQAILHIPIENWQKATITIYNSLGSIVFMDKIYQYAGDNSYNLNADKWPNGVYFVCTKAGSTQFANRMIVAR